MDAGCFIGHRHLEVFNQKMLNHTVSTVPGRTELNCFSESTFCPQLVTDYIN